MLPEKLCLVMEMRLDGRLYMPKHLAFHNEHNWWYTHKGGGHQMFEGFMPSDPTGWDEREGFVKHFHCPGWRP